MQRLCSLLAPLLLAGSLLTTPTAVAGDSAASSSTASALSFGEALNAFRARHGLGGLREDRALTRAAQAYARDMAAHDYFSHTGRDGSTVLTRARAAGCNGRGYFAENIAWGQDSANDAFQGWAASSGHRANMLGRNYGAFGLGQSGGYWVLVFADGC
jgi:uncharacterized protein YkwD